MEYQVPQFIEVEDKIFGPLTLKQFIYLAGGAGLCAVLILNLHAIGFVLAVPIAAFSAALAFYKINSKSFTDIVEAGFNFYTSGRLYLWKKDSVPTKKAQVAPATNVTRQKLSLSKGKLRDLAWSLDIKDSPTNNPS